MRNSERYDRPRRREDVGLVAPARPQPTRPTNENAENDETGETTVSAVILAPLLLLIMFAVIQFAVGWHAKSALDAAAEDGLRAAQTNIYADPVDAAKASAQTNARFVDHLTISTTPPGPGRLTVTVTGVVLGPFPGTHWSIVGRASGPLDRFRLQGQP